MKLILTRHGETIENTKRIMQGHLPGVLSDLGILQGKKLSETLKDYKFDYIYSSDLNRTVDTAKEIHKYHKKTPLVFTEKLRERNLGDWKGKTKAEIGIDNIMITYNFDPPNGEKLDDLYKRAKSFILDLLKKHKDQTILIVTHNGFAQILISVIKNNKFDDLKLREDLKNQKKLDNTSISIFEINDDRSYNIIMYNNTDHLDN